MRKKLNIVKIPIVICTMMLLLCGCSLFVTDKDKFYMDKNLDYSLSRIDIDKSGKDIVIPAKVGDIAVLRIYLADPYYSKIDSLDVSKVKDLESFYIKLFGKGSTSKLKELDFSMNNKLRSVHLSDTESLYKLVLNKNCESISLYNTAVKKLDLRVLKNAKYITYVNGPIEELDISKNANLEYLTITNCKVKSLDVSKNPKLKKITVDEGTQIIGLTNAQIEYNKRNE